MSRTMPQGDAAVRARARVRAGDGNCRAADGALPSAAASPPAADGALRRRLLQAALAGVLPAGLSAFASAQPSRTTAPAASAGDDGALEAALRAGGVAVLLRHAATTPGVGDPPGFRPGECATQRNLSADGREQARRIGAWFERRGLVPAAVRSSAWCRCIDTAVLAFGRQTPWPPLDSTFAERDADPAATRRRLDEALRTLPAGRFEVWVTHQVNVTAATGAFVDMGEGLVVRAGDAAGAMPVVLGRLAFEA